MASKLAIICLIEEAHAVRTGVKGLVETGLTCASRTCMPCPRPASSNGGDDRRGAADGFYGRRTIEDWKTWRDDFLIGRGAVVGIIDEEI
ncbi:MAG: hypothetical protein L6R41_005511, partial [Letrouitia leprolyta]